MRLEGWHLIIIVALAILLFGAPKLPGLARSVGQSLRIFKSEVKQMKEDGHDPAAPDTTTNPVNTTADTVRTAEPQVLNPSSVTAPASTPASTVDPRRGEAHNAEGYTVPLNGRSDAHAGSTAPSQPASRP